MKRVDRVRRSFYQHTFTLFHHTFTLFRPNGVEFKFHTVGPTVGPTLQTTQTTTNQKKTTVTLPLLSVSRLPLTMNTPKVTTTDKDEEREVFTRINTGSTEWYQLGFDVSSSSEDEWGRDQSSSSEDELGFIDIRFIQRHDDGFRTPTKILETPPTPTLSSLPRTQNTETPPTPTEPHRRPVKRKLTFPETSPHLQSPRRRFKSLKYVDELEKMVKYQLDNE